MDYGCLIHVYNVCSQPVVISVILISCAHSRSLSHSWLSQMFLDYRYLIHGCPVCSYSIVISSLVSLCLYCLSLSHSRFLVCASIIFISFIFKRVCVQSLSLSQSLLIQCVNSRSLSLSQLPCMFISYRSLIHGYHVCVHSRCYHIHGYPLFTAIRVISFIFFPCVHNLSLSHSWLSCVFIVYKCPFQWYYIVDSILLSNC